MEITSEELTAKILQEKQMNGLIILKAIYGKPAVVNREYRKELKRTNRKNVVSVQSNVLELLDNDKGYMNTLGLENLFCEILDIRVLLQMRVANSRLSVSTKWVKGMPGMFNPCVDEEGTPHLFLKYYLDGRVYVVYLDGQESLDIDKEIEPKFTKFRPEFSLLKWLNRQ